jgi:hypothetical protein
LRADLGEKPADGKTLDVKVSSFPEPWASASHLYNAAQNFPTLKVTANMAAQGAWVRTMSRPRGPGGYRSSLRDATQVVSSWGHLCPLEGLGEQLWVGVGRREPPGDSRRMRFFSYTIKFFYYIFFKNNF